MSDKCEHGEWEDSCPCCLRYEMSMLAKQLEQANKELASAHRDATEEVAKAHKRGWEQGKREAREHCFKMATNGANHDMARHSSAILSDIIAAMEYGGKAND